MATSTKKKLGPGRHLSAIKRHRQNQKRRLQNKAALSEMRSAVKKLLQTIQSADKVTATSLLQSTQSLLDRAIKKGLLPARTAQRKISRLHRRVSHL